jgi:hypothetical protein
MTGARVHSVDALTHFRVALIKFSEAANAALGDSDSEVQRTLMWLQGEQQQFWTGQIRKRHEKVNQCKDAVRQKKLYKDSTGKTQSAVDEEKALAIAQKRLAEAEQKLANTKRHSLRLQKEMHMYKGAVQRLSTQVTAELPNAVASLDRMVAALEAYLTLTAAGGTGEWNPPPLDEGVAASVEGASSMARAEPGEEAKEREEQAAKDEPAAAPEAQRES